MFWRTRSAANAAARPVETTGRSQGDGNWMECEEARRAIRSQRGGATGPAIGQLVDPAAGRGNRHQQDVATRRRHRRVVRGHMNDAFDAAARAGPGDGDRGGVRDLRRWWALLADCRLEQARSSAAVGARDGGKTMSRARDGARGARDIVGQLLPRAAGVEMVAQRHNNEPPQPRSAGTRPTNPAGWGFPCSTAWET